MGRCGAAKAKTKNKSGGARSHTGDYSAALNTETRLMGRFQERKPGSTETTEGGGGGQKLRPHRKSLIKVGEKEAVNDTAMVAEHIRGVREGGG